VQQAEHAQRRVFALAKDNTHAAPKQGATTLLIQILMDADTVRAEFD